MKWVLRILGVVALLLAALSVAAANHAKKEPKQLVVDVVRTFHTPRGNNKLTVGERFFSNLDVFEEGTFGTAEEKKIGEGIWYGVATSWGWWESQTIRIDEQGVIFGEDTGLPWEGAIIGGTGEFAGASGEYVGDGLGGDPQVSRITFTFEN